MSTAKILAVDDEPDFEALLTQRFRRQIRDREFSFRFSHHGEEALKMLEADPEIELMLLDINMSVTGSPCSRTCMTYDRRSRRSSCPRMAT